MVKLIIFYHLKEWYIHSYPVMYMYLSIKQHKDLLLTKGVELIDYFDFLSEEDKNTISQANKKIIELDYSSYKSYVAKAVSTLVDIMRESDIYDNSILLGFQSIGSDPLFFRKERCPYDFYDIFKSKNCKFMKWYDDLHGYPGFPKIKDYNPNMDYSKLGDYRLDLTDIILTPSKYYYENINSQYLKKSIFYFYCLNENWYNNININNFNDRKHKILFSGAVFSYPNRKLVHDMYLYHHRKSLPYSSQTDNNIFLDKYKKFDTELMDLFELLTIDKKIIGIDYLHKISEFKAAFFGYADKPINFNLAKIIEILMCGTLGFFEFSPILESELGLIAYKHYVPITDENNELIKDINYYLKYLNTCEGEKIALDGATYVRENFGSINRINQLVDIINSINSNT